ncbi:MAG: hypothetical protein HYZ27_11705 [Deltaproteobacteria bacterium]|nr:hypothetical protein [Deltaproteobacteria bacterium]
MKHTLYAVLAACLAMLATSGIVALATAATASAPPEEELVALVDDAIAAQLARIKDRLSHATPSSP